MVLKAIKQGLLTRPESCSFCGRIPTPAKDGRAKIQGHHYHGYDNEHILDVEWLCPSCHKIKHPNDAEALAKISKANKGKIRSEASRSKQKETIKYHTGEKKGWTEERRELQRQRMILKWSDPEQRLAQAERAKRDKPWLGRAV